MRTKKKIDIEVIYKMGELAKKIDDDNLRNEILSAIGHFVVAGKVKCQDNMLFGSIDSLDFFSIIFKSNEIIYNRLLNVLGEENKTTIKFINLKELEVIKSKSYAIKKDDKLEKMHKYMEKNHYTNRILDYQEIVTNDFSTALNDDEDNITTQVITHRNNDGAISACHKIYQNYPNSSYSAYYQTDNWNVLNYDDCAVDKDLSLSMTGISKEEYNSILNELKNKNTHKVLVK